MSDMSKVKVNLGSKVASVDSKWHGFSISYEEGDICRRDTGSAGTTFSTQIDFHCDVHQTGWPTFVNRTDCVFHFEWHTVYACKLCETGDIVKLMSE